jgi:hypothetical protein
MDPFTIAMLGGTAASVGSGILGQRAAGQAAGAQSQAAMMSAIIQAQQAEAARRQQQEMFDKAVALQEPFRQGGVGATNRLADLYGTSGRTGAAGYGSYAEMPTFAQLQMDPGYQFRFEQGMRGVNASAAARAGLQSGAALKAATEFGQGMGTQEYQNAYNRFMANRQQAAEAMAGLAGRGAGVAQGLGQQAVSTGANMANTMLAGGQALGQGLENMGQARASGYMGGASALSQALQAVPQNAMAYAMYDRMYPSQDAASIGGAPSGYVRYNPNLLVGPPMPNYGPPMPGMR